MARLSGRTISSQAMADPARIEDGHLKAKNGDQSLDLQHVTRSSPTLGHEAAEGRDRSLRWKEHGFVVQDDGKGMVEGRRPLHVASGSRRCRVRGGPTLGQLHQQRAFSDAKIHVEFRKYWGNRANSDVYIQDRYELHQRDLRKPFRPIQTANSITPSRPSRQFVPRARYSIGRPSTSISKLQDSMRPVRRLPMQS